MIGIYKYENKINHKCYIGQSINIKQRQDNHRSAAYNTKANDYDSGLSPKEIQLKYAPDKAWSTIYNVVTRQTYKDIN